jgi:hypothetical protein
MNEYNTPDAGKRLAMIILAVGACGRPYVSTPTLPPDRAKLLHSAFKKTLNDPGFQAQQKNGDWMSIPSRVKARNLSPGKGSHSHQKSSSA